MIVVSDTSPIYYLVQIGVAELLPELYGEVVIPPAVLSELKHPACPCRGWAESLPAWLSVREPTVVDDSLSLDRGEREAIALAAELAADFLLIDERLGRLAAKRRGLRVAGTLAVLVDAAISGLTDLDRAVAALRQTNFYLTDELVLGLRRELERRRSR